VNLKEVLNKTTNSLRASFTAKFITEVFLVTWIGQVTLSRVLCVMKPGYFFLKHCCPERAALLSGGEQVMAVALWPTVHAVSDWRRWPCCSLGRERAFRAVMGERWQGGKKMALGHRVFPCWAQLPQFCLGLWCFWCCSSYYCSNNCRVI